MTTPPESLCLQLAKHSYQMHSMMLALLVSNQPILAAEYLKTLTAILEHQEGDLTEGLQDAACDIQSQLIFLLGRANPPVIPAGSARNRPSWLIGVIDGGA